MRLIFSIPNLWQKILIDENEFESIWLSTLRGMATVLWKFDVCKLNN